MKYLWRLIGWLLNKLYPHWVWDADDGNHWCLHCGPLWEEGYEQHDYMARGVGPLGIYQEYHYIALRIFNKTILTTE